MGRLLVTDGLSITRKMSWAIRGVEVKRKSSTRQMTSREACPHTICIPHPEMHYYKKNKTGIETKYNLCFFFCFFPWSFLLPTPHPSPVLSQSLCLSFWQISNTLYNPGYRPRHPWREMLSLSDVKLSHLYIKVLFPPAFWSWKWTMSILHTPGHRHNQHPICASQPLYKHLQSNELPYSQPASGSYTLQGI